MNALPLVLFGLLCAGLGALITGLFWAAAMHREREVQLAADRLRRSLLSQTWAEAKW